MRRRAASSSSSGRLVAPTIRSRRSEQDGSHPSICTSISVLSRRLASCSPSDLRALRMESISSMKMTAGWRHPASVKSVRTIFSPSPIHLEVSELALMLKNVALMFDAIALPISVLPVPGGPKSSKPLGGVRTPLKRFGLSIGHTTISCTRRLASPWPTMSDQLMPVRSMMSLQMFSTSCRSSFRICSGIWPSRECSKSISITFGEKGGSSSPLS
mmetsp:Transcript_12449/g.31516  ORF Transcript_12449/g.31516 Transcript_12449/m.31516 type:complete len:215 (-) Transcript_12449:155-799(-)